MKRHTREDIREKLDVRLSGGDPLIVCEAGVGIIASLAEDYGADMIVASSLACVRIKASDDSMAHKPYGNSNEMTMDLVNRLRFAVKDIPVVAGVNPSDPWTFLEDHIAMMRRMGVSGFSNMPSWGATNQSRAVVERNGFGIVREIEWLDEMKKAGEFTLANAYTQKEAIRFAALQPDMQIINLRYVVEPSTTPELYNDMDACCEYIRETCRRIKEISPDTYVVVHGGPFSRLENIAVLFEKTKVEGYYGSSIFDEKMMTESIASSQVAFQSIKLR